MTAILSSLVLIWRRIQSNWRLLLVVFAGILAATTLLAAAPLYLGATSELGICHTFEYERTGVPDTTVLLLYQPIDRSGYLHAQEPVRTRTETIRHLVVGEVSHITTPSLGVTFPPPTFYGPTDARASINAFSGYEEHTDVIDGAFPRAGAAASDGVIEVAIGEAAAPAPGPVLLHWQRPGTEQKRPLDGTPAPEPPPQDGGTMEPDAGDDTQSDAEPERSPWARPLDPGDRAIGSSELSSKSSHPKRRLDNPLTPLLTSTRLVAL